MSEIYPETPAASPGPAHVTPGQRAFATYYGLLSGAALLLDESWNMQSAETRDAWEAAAQAVLDDARVPSLSINFDGEVTEERAAEIRKAMEAAIRPKPVARVIPAAAPELAEAMAETRRVRELVAEILGTYAGDTGKPGVLTSLATPDQRNRWRRRAGLGDPAAAEPLPRRTPGETRAAENAALGDWGKLIAERDQLGDLVAEIIDAIGTGKTILAATVAGWQRRAQLTDAAPLPRRVPGRRASRCTYWSDPSDDFYGMCVKDAWHDREGDSEHENEHGIRWTGDRWEAPRRTPGAALAGEGEAGL